jgi:hypothetical protein
MATVIAKKKETGKEIENLFEKKKTKYGPNVIIPACAK